ncbi:MAG: hypothetical protein ACXAC2_24730 [Candidatus Kariarchaeaceae archaeon]|jgi:hypothetical protein
MRYLLAIANYFGNKVHYFRTDDQLSRVIVGTYEEPLFIDAVEAMFKDWQKVEDLIVYDDNLNFEFQKFDRRK